ncbi:MAG TPA: hypothetical protein PLD73_01435 [Candidatus Hydrogenedentes bacterium]|nr:hypothetical protein [Candidatus Hydrogenedentota bacterium]
MATFLSGKVSSIKADDVGATLRTFSDVASNIQLNMNMETSDVSAFSQAYKSFIAGQYSGTLSFDIMYDATAVGYLNALFLAGTATDIEYSPAGDTVEYGFKGIISSINISSNLSDAVKGSVTFQITGAIALG